MKSHITAYWCWQSGQPAPAQLSPSQLSQLQAYASHLKQHALHQLSSQSSPSSVHHKPLSEDTKVAACSMLQCLACKHHATSYARFWQFQLPWLDWLTTQQRNRRQKRVCSFIICCKWLHRLHIMLPPTLCKVDRMHYHVAYQRRYVHASGLHKSLHCSHSPWSLIKGQNSNN